MDPDPVLTARIPGSVILLLFISPAPGHPGRLTVAIILCEAGYDARNIGGMRHGIRPCG
ncbi:hypothetical protein [Methanoculleus sp. UBA430]|uniref:hypothetical protein n=1 Tax=Methanoculleus sp. UBA430 TaxID=1915511 RepID=UPI0025D9D36E|nr:hypothetical protein [Methanoculleus sp. UBA430]